MTAISAPNRMQRQLAGLDAVPAFLRKRLRQWLMHRAVPFTGTAGVAFERLDADGVTLQLANRRRVQNHIHGIHACATALLAETASGLALGMHIPDDRLPLLKSMTIRYTRRAEGGLTASAALTAEQRAALHASERGEVNIAVSVHDDSNETPVECEMIWAWRPRQQN